MTKADAQAMATRIANRLIKDEGIEDADQYIAVAAEAIMDVPTDDPDLQWHEGRQAILAYRRTYNDERMNRHLAALTEAKATQSSMADRDSKVAIVKKLSTEDKITLSLALQASLKSQTVRVLTPREIETLRLMATGHNSVAAAAKLKVSPETSRTHYRNIRAKLGAKTGGHAVALGLKLGYIKLKDI